MFRLTPTVAVGIVSGLLFFAHAMINDSHAWPLIWPLAGGVAAVWLAARRHRLNGFWSGLRASAGAGALAAVLFSIASAVAMTALDLIPPGRAQAAALGIAIAAVSGFAAATIAGALAYPLARRTEPAG